MENKKFNPVWILVVLVVGFFIFNLVRTPATPSKSSDSLQPEQTAPAMQTTETTTAPNDDKLITNVKVQKGNTAQLGNTAQWV